MQTLSPPIAVRLSLPLPFPPPLPPPPLLLHVSIPFHQATENCSSPPVAYFAQDVDMQLTLMRATKNQQLSLMGHAPGPASIMAASLQVQARASAPTTTSEEVPLAPTATALTKLSTFALSAAALLTMPSHGIAGLVPPLEEPLTLLLLLLDYPDLSHTIKPCPAFDPSLHLSPEIFDSIVQLYNLSAFESMLALHDLTQAYPFLVQNLHHGFPLRVFPKIHRTVIYKSLPFDSDSVAAITAYLDKKLLAGRMSGPFTCVEIVCILRGPFVCSPFVVSSQFQGLDIPDKLCVC